MKLGQKLTNCVTSRCEQGFRRTLGNSRQKLKLERARVLAFAIFLPASKIFIITNFFVTKALRCDNENERSTVAVKTRTTV